MEKKVTGQRRNRTAGTPVCENLESRRLLAATISLDVLRAVGSENNPDTVGRAWARFTRSGDSIAQPLNVKYSIRPVSTATAGQDYQALSGVITLPAGRASINLPIRPIDDAQAENPEVIVMTLATGNYAINSQKNVGRFYIADNDGASAKPSVSVAITKAVAAEADTAGKQAAITFTRTGSTAAALNVSYALTGSAVNGTDYESLPGIATIPAGQSSVTVQVTAIDDSLVEPAEWARVILNAHPTNYTVDAAKPNGLFYIASEDTQQGPQGWWDSQWGYRTAVTFNSGSHARTDKPFVANVNFTSALNDAGASGSLISNSIRVVETDAAGTTVLDESVPFQFDPAGNFDAASNAAGQLVVLAEGNTSASTTRYYHVYFDTEGTFQPADVTPLITVTDDVTDEGFSTIRIATAQATYFYKKASGGLSSLVDSGGQDWLNFHPTPGSGATGEYRGLPNSVAPGGGFHPNFANGTTTIVSSGPLRTVLRTDSSVDRGDGEGPEPWSITWEFYPAYATCRITPPDSEETYWFLYEGTPGGSISGNDYSMRPNGTEAPIDTSWEDSDGLGTGAEDEWVYFGDKDVNRFLFLANHADDGLVDSHRVMDGAMTVFGFGRNNNPGNDLSFLTGPSQFTVGLAAGGEYNAARTLITGAYRDVSVNVGSSQKL